MKKYKDLMEQNLTRLFSAYLTQDDELLISSIKKIIDSTHQLAEPASVYQRLFNQTKMSIHDGSYIPSSATKMISHEGKLQPTSARDEWKRKHITIKKGESEKKHFKIDQLFLPKTISKKIKTLEVQYRNRELLKIRGLQAVNRILLIGEPGGGKTSLAKQISIDLGLKMDEHSISSIIDSALGGTGKQIHNIFSGTSSELLFLDEFDAIGASRKQSNDLGEMNRVVNVLLQEMDNLNPDTFLVAATNFPKRLDSAILRRFPVIIKLPRPDFEDRVRYMQQFSVEHGIQVKNSEISKTAKLTTGQSYADLRSFMMNYAIAEISEQNRKLQLSKFFIEEMDMRETIDDSKLAKWIHQKSISITDLSNVLGIPRTTLSSRLKRVGDNNEK